MTHVVDVILVLVAIEAAALVWFFRNRGTGIPPAKLLPNLAAGFFLMLDIRLALAGSPAWALLACLAAALSAHLLDMAQRWTDAARA